MPAPELRPDVRARPHCRRRALALAVLTLAAVSCSEPEKNGRADESPAAAAGRALPERVTDGPATGEPSIAGAAASAPPNVMPAPTSPVSWPAASVPSARPLQPRLVISGRDLKTERGEPFVLRSLTSFRLLDYVADGNEAAVLAWMDYASAKGFNDLRVLGMLCCWFELAPADGQRALPRLFELAAERGLYISLVALAGTREGSYPRPAMRQQVEAMASLCHASATCSLFSIANEYAHPSQRPDLRDPGFMRELAAAIPDGVNFTAGSNCCGQSDEEAPHPIDRDRWIAIHLDRGAGLWDQARRVRTLEALSARTGKHVVNEERIGAGPVDEPGRRATDADVHFAFGALDRIMGVSGVHHTEAGLQAVPPPPGSVEDRAAEAYIAGTRIAADDVRFSYRNCGQVAPLESPCQEMSGAVRLYSGVAVSGPPQHVAVAIGVGPQFTWRPRGNWQIVETLTDRPGVKAWRVSPR